MIHREGVYKAGTELDCFFTLQQAREAYKEVLPAAQDHFDLCKQELLALMERLKFGIDFDAAGSGEENDLPDFQYIHFKMGGCEFRFKLEI
jgi:hypothetical protein